MNERKKNFLNLIKNILNITWKIIYQCLIILIIILTLIIVLQKVSENNKALGGYRIFKVVSGSMLPKYNIGEVVICKEKDMKQIKAGDDIVYLGQTGEIKGKIIMHEVTKIETDSNGRVKIIAKGLDNTVADPVIDESQVYGVVVVKSQILTVLYSLANNIYSFFIIFITLVINVFVSWKKGKSHENLEVKTLNEENKKEEKEKLIQAKEKSEEKEEKEEKD